MIVHETYRQIRGTEDRVLDFLLRSLHNVQHEYLGDPTDGKYTETCCGGLFWQEDGTFGFLTLHSRSLRESRVICLGGVNAGLTELRYR